ncbi:MAG: response regulator transcription factor [Bacteroidota bacterium]|nr:response regulator transcription factor [Bacteroidota bacterium]
MKSKVRIAIAEDHPLFRKGITSFIEEYEEYKVIWEASNGQEVLAHLKTNKPDVLLLDLRMPVMDGFETIDMIRRKRIDCKIVILTSYSDDHVIYSCIERGVNGFLRKDQAGVDLINAVNTVLEIDYYFDESFAKSLVRQTFRNKENLDQKSVSLSKREIEIIKLICAEFTNAEMADKLFLSTKTIESYRNSLLKKTGARNTAGVVIYAIERGLVDSLKFRD